jgi:outer membrane lipoprotein-sorting protein
MKYTSPARIEGMKILMHNDGEDIWFYSPRTSRVRKIAEHQKNQSVAGSDFSYEDMSSQDMREDYNAALDGEEIRDGVACYKIHLTAKSKDKTYSKAILWVDKEKFVTLHAHFYDEFDQLWKKMHVENVVEINGYWTPKKIEMQNVLKGSRTVMIMDSIAYDVSIDESMFSLRALKR